MLLITKEQQDRLLYEIYCEANRTLLLREKKGRHYAITEYKKFLNTSETMVKIMEPRFDLREHLGLYVRGLSVESLGYVLTLPFDERKGQFKHFDGLVKAYEKSFNEKPSITY